MLVRIEVDERACTGCRLCEAVCSIAHEDGVGPGLARIWVLNTDLWGPRRVVVCRQCADPACEKACPVGAIKVVTEESVRYVAVDRDLCVGCGACEDSCPYGAIAMHPDKPWPIKCDLCGGDPACVKYCAAGALSAATGSAPVRARERRLRLVKKGN